jgi:hypothetical protein
MGQAFRSAVGFPEEAKHLFAQQFQGQFWGQLNGKDWTPSAFLSSEEGGLGFDLARDRATIEALQEQLENVLQAPLEDLRGKKLQAHELNLLGTEDPVRDLLKWIGDPEVAEKRWNHGRRKGFVAICKKDYGFDPKRDGVITALEKLVAGGGKWDQVWRRYVEAPRSFVGVRRALEQVQPKSLLDFENARLPANNRRREESLRQDLTKCEGLPWKKALERLSALCGEHAARARSVWAELGEAALARAAIHLADLTTLVKAGFAGSDFQAFAAEYVRDAWRVDAAAWRALACVREAHDLNAVGAALRSVYLPWLEDLAERVQTLMGDYPSSLATAGVERHPKAGTVLLFVDGLRCDLGLELRAELKEKGLEVEFATSWAAMPTVTATAKPAWRPMADLLVAKAPTEGYEPQGAESHKPLKSNEYRALLQKLGWEWFEASSTGDPKGSGWTEIGAFDRYGHEQGAKLAWRIEEELEVVRQRIRELLGAGWFEVVVLTDHGWLLAPGGLPKVELPGHLTISKWGRCALPQPGAMHGFRETSWFWGPEHAVVLAPGISVFKAGMEYAHGGATIQEALTPVLTVTNKEAPVAAARIEASKWGGLRLQVTVEGGGAGVALDLRSKPADPTSSLLSADQRMKSPDAGGKVALLVENDDLSGQAAVLVVVQADHPERVLSQQATIIGGE